MLVMVECQEVKLSCTVDLYNGPALTPLICWTGL